MRNPFPFIITVMPFNALFIDLDDTLPEFQRQRGRSGSA
jgi:hypothetical protein